MPERNGPFSSWQVQLKTISSKVIDVSKAGLGLWPIGRSNCMGTGTKLLHERLSWDQWALFCVCLYERDVQRERRKKSWDRRQRRKERMRVRVGGWMEAIEYIADGDIKMKESVTLKGQCSLTHLSRLRWCNAMGNLVLVQTVKSIHSLTWDESCF